jgi:hypothetical protein
LRCYWNFGKTQNSDGEVEAEVNNDENSCSCSAVRDEMKEPSWFLEPREQEIDTTRVKRKFLKHVPHDSRVS